MYILLNFNVLECAFCSVLLSLPIFRLRAAAASLISRNICLPFKILNCFVPGRAGTEEFVPGQLLLPLSWDNGTPGQEIFFVPGQRDNGTSRPGLSRDVPSLGNTTLNLSSLDFISNGILEISGFCWSKWAIDCLIFLIFQIFNIQPPRLLTNLKNESFLNKTIYT